MGSGKIGTGLEIVHLARTWCPEALALLLVRDNKFWCLGNRLFDQDSLQLDVYVSRLRLFLNHQDPGITNLNASLSQGNVLKSSNYL